jgi:hypothetical protein
MVQAVSRRPLTAETRVRSRVSPCGFVVDKVALGQVSPRVPRFSPVNRTDIYSMFTVELQSHGTTLIKMLDR